MELIGQVARGMGDLKTQWETPSQNVRQGTIEKETQIDH